MKHKISFALSSIIALLTVSCMPRIQSSFISESSKQESSFASSSSNDDVSSSSDVSSSGSIESEFAFLFDNKEDGLTLDQINEEINKIKPKPQEQRKVRYTWHIVEKLTGNYQKAMLDGTQMPEGEIVGDFVSEPKNHNLDSNIKIISGTPVTQMQKEYAQNYTSSVTPSGWLSHHAVRRRFLDSAQEGEGFEERFYANPITLWMRSWGRRPANAQMDGVYFSYSELERVYDANGYCTTFKVKEYTYMKGTLTSFNNGSVDYDGSYEYTLTCGIEYLEE